MIEVASPRRIVQSQMIGLERGGETGSGKSNRTVAAGEAIDR